jgi:hypothetical protein
VTPYLHDVVRQERDVLELEKMLDLCDTRSELNLPSPPDANVRITESD